MRLARHTELEATDFRNRFPLAPYYTRSSSLVNLFSYGTMAIRTDATPEVPSTVGHFYRLRAVMENFVHTTGHREQFRITSYEPKIGLLSRESNEDLLSPERSLAVVLSLVTASMVSAQDAKLFSEKQSNARVRLRSSCLQTRARGIGRRSGERRIGVAPGLWAWPTSRILSGNVTQLAATATKQLASAEN